MIVITGGAGFIGSVLCEEINQFWKRNDILIVDSLDYDESWKNLRNVQFEEIIAPDKFLELIDSEDGDKFLDQLDCIFHLGACSSTTEKDFSYLLENNTEFSKILFEIATEFNIPFVYASSAATYGDGRHGYSDEHNKTKQLRPLNAYGFSKKLFDDWALKQKQTPSLWAGVKFFNVFGPNEYHKDDMTSLVYKAFHQIKESGNVKLFKSYKSEYKDGYQMRDFIYVKDVVKALMQIMRCKKSKGIYNLGTGKANSFFDLVDYTFKAMQISTKVEFIDMPENIKNQYQYFTKADMTKFKKLLPDFNFLPLEDSVKDYVCNYLQIDDFL